MALNVHATGAGSSRMSFIERRERSDRRQMSCADDLYERLKEKLDQIESDRRKGPRRQIDRGEETVPGPAASRTGAEAQRWANDFVDDPASDLPKEH
jgi:hypothetical protein